MRALTPVDVLEQPFQHVKERNPNLASSLVGYALNNVTALTLDRDASIQRLKALGYTRNLVAEDAVACAEACVKFCAKLTEMGYRWDEWYGKIVPPIEKVV